MTTKPNAAKLQMASDLAEKLAMIKTLAYEKRLVEAAKAVNRKKEKHGYNLNSPLSKLSVSD